MQSYFDQLEDGVLLGSQTFELFKFNFMIGPHLFQQGNSNNMSSILWREGRWGGEGEVIAHDLKRSILK